MSSKLSLKRCVALIVTAFLMFASVYAQQLRVSGRVTDSATGETLPGVNVAVKGSTIGVATDANGAYSISVNRGSVLVFSYLSYISQEVSVGDNTTISVALVPSALELGEVVVTALGIRRAQKALGYAVSKIEAKEITKVGSPNFASALYGKAAGVRIQTAPGGATSAVSINIRGMNSINYSNQPLIVVDGVPIRNGEANNADYWGDQRIRGNGLIDINPQDIEDLTVLKGASASALYGSEAANGVIVITTKKGTKQKGLGVEANYNYMVESPTSLPNFQNEYGPGYDLGTNVGGFGTDSDSWLTVSNPKYYDEASGTYKIYDGDLYRPAYRAYAQFGPKFDGRQVIGWDNKIHEYVAQPDNYRNLFQNGMNSTANVAVSKSGDFGSFRVSYTRLDYQGTQRGGRHNKNNFNIMSTLNLSKNLKVDLKANYINQYTLNRAYRISRITNNYGGFLSRFDDAQWYLDNYQTSKGYYYRTGGNASATPDENIIYNMRGYDLLDFFWKTLNQKNEENQDRLITSATATWTIFDGLSFRGRIGNDFTSISIEQRNPNEYPISIGNSGSFGMSSDKLSNTYADALLTYDKKIGNDFGLTVNAGFITRREAVKSTSVWTSGGLSTENWFHINASVNTGTQNGSASYTELLKYAFFGTASFSFKDYAFVEITGRQESSSTLPPESNTFFYPSVNASFIFSDAFHLPSVIDFGKIRVGYGIVGNAPNLYAANNAYNQGSINGIVYNTVSTSYGNDFIRPEEKHEFETGLEMKFLGNRLGFEASFYHNRIVDQILQLSVPTTVGASTMLANVGELKNVGFEGRVYATPLESKDFRWDVSANFLFNRNEVVSLMEGVDRLTHREIDAGAAKIISEPGKPMGDIICYLPKVDENGNYIVDPVDGLYQINFDEMQTVGNVMPKMVGGFTSYFEFKNFFVDFTIDYNLGSKVISIASHYMTGAGMFEETLQYRDAEHGGVSYYIEGYTGASGESLTGRKIAFEGEAGPNGEKMFHDGVILDGVLPDGSPNNVIVDAANYYLNTYTWGANPSWGIPYSRYDLSVKKNDYVKFRELSIGYNLPASFAKKLGCNNVRIALIGSNLFYLYRTFKDFDPETTLGTNWISAAVVDGSTVATRSLGFSIHASF
ncbi:MAG: SusC/RagA family TonB-linked outer membrane protein [Bacteroidota bacterium]